MHQALSYILISIQTIKTRKNYKYKNNIYTLRELVYRRRGVLGGQQVIGKEIKALFWRGSDILWHERVLHAASRTGVA